MIITATGIGGSTYIKDGDPVTYFDYISNSTGKKIS